MIPKTRWRVHGDKILNNDFVGACSRRRVLSTHVQTADRYPETLPKTPPRVQRVDVTLESIINAQDIMRQL